MIRLLMCLVFVLPASQAMGEDAMFVPAPGSPIMTKGSPGASVAADINADGAVDLIVSNLKLGYAQIFLGDNTGQFKLLPDSTLKTSGMMAVLDANEDSKLDIAAIDEGGYGVEIYLGDRKGGFTRAPGSPFQTFKGNEPHPRGIAVADINEDGHADVFLSNQKDDNVGGILGNGKAGFATMPAPFKVGKLPFNVEFLDVNNDRHVDLCTPTDEGRQGQISIWYGDGKGAFSAGIPFESATNANWVAFGDVNGDHKVDIAMNQVDMPMIVVGVGDGTGRFTKAPGSPIQLKNAPYASHVELADANGDGNKDVFVATGGTIQVFLSDGKGGFSPAAGSPYIVGKGAWHLVTGDFNKDGKSDVAVPNFEGGTVVVLLAR